MIILLAFIGFATIFAVLAGAILWRRWSSGGPVTATLDEQQLRILDVSVSAVYRPVSRLFREEDFQFLSGQAGFRPKMAGRLRRARWQVLRSYLSELRADFHQTVGIGRMLAIQSENPGFAAFVSGQAIKFYVQFSVIYIHCFLGRASHAQREVAGLADTLERFRGTMRTWLIAQSQPALANH